MEQDLNFIADEIERFYIKKRKQVLGDSVFTPSTAKYRAAFRKAAELCVELDAEPEMYVIAQFANIDQQKLATIVNFLHTDKAKEYYNSYISAMTLSYPQWYDLQLSYLKDQVELTHRPVIRALMDDNLNFKPWFRVSITKEPVKEIIDKYGEEAREQYEGDKKLREFFVQRQLDHKRFIK